MSNQRVTLRGVEWQELFPWLLILRTFRVAINASVLLLALVAVFLVPIGWNVSHVLFLRKPFLDQHQELQLQVNRNERLLGNRATGRPQGFGDSPIPPGTPFLSTIFRSDPVTTVYVSLTAPVRNLYHMPGFRGDDSDGPPSTVYAYFIFGQLWTLAVWAFFAGAITRIAVMQLGKFERVGLMESILFSCKRFVSFFLAPLFPLVLALLVAIPLLALRLIMNVDFGIFIAGLFWWLAMLFGFLLAIVFVGLMFGWPLMWGVIAGERDGDAFEAFSRVFTYVFQRPLHYLFYTVVAMFFGSLCLLLTDSVIQLTIDLTGWTVGNPTPATGGSSPDAPGSLFKGGEYMIAGTTNAIRGLVVAFSYGLFWSLAGAIYLLLRKDSDETEFDELYDEADDDRQSLPRLRAEQAVPEVDQVATPPLPTGRSESTNPSDDDSISAADESPDGEDKT